MENSKWITLEEALLWQEIDNLPINKGVYEQLKELPSKKLDMRITIKNLKEIISKLF